MPSDEANRQFIDGTIRVLRKRGVPDDAIHAALAHGIEGVGGVSIAHEVSLMLVDLIKSRSRCSCCNTDSESAQLILRTLARFDPSLWPTADQVFGEDERPDRYGNGIATTEKAIYFSLVDRQIYSA
jgi:hypothetical protein